MSFWSSILDTLFPPRCLVCEKNLEQQGNALCEECSRTITVPDTLFCGTCGARLPLGKKICHESTPYRLGSVALYEHTTIRNLIRGMKFGRMETIGVFLGNLLADYVEHLNPPLDILHDPKTLIIPIPLSEERLRERGFNQASTIASTFAKRFSKTATENILIRTKHSLPQSQTESRAMRLENVRESFGLDPKKTVRGFRILLVDDVTTTGATLRAAAATLKEGGAKEIVALTIAR